ncbi:MAG: hypothetical protein C0466_07615 [Candidatus Accumulibacter sp.]|nr:hypothetical protein [Accumulibacter sp.]
MTAPVASRAGFSWDLRATHAAAASCRLPWSLPGAGHVVDGGVTLVAGNGRWLRPLRATVSLAEGSPYWSADITLGSEEEAVQLDVGDGLALSMCGHVFSLRVDQRAEDEQGPVTRSWRVQALSPLAWLDSPYVLSSDIYFPAGTTASEAVAELLAPAAALAWALPDWTLPTAGLTFTSTTPVAAARAIVEAIGGLLESLPDGSVVARRRYPMAPDRFASAVPDIELFDSEAVSRSVSTLHVEIVNRLSVSDGADGVSAQDRLVYEPGANPLAGTVRAWPNPWRPVRLVHTGRPEVVIEARGVRTWAVKETVEFKDGQATLSTPALALQAVEWRYVDLGGVTLDGETLTAAYGEGYSLADVRYTTRAWVWAVADDKIEDVQFLLEDDDDE